MKNSRILLLMLAAFASLPVLESRADIGAFTPDMAGWSRQGYPDTPAYWRDGIVTLNTSGYYSADSIFYLTQQNVSHFSASFVWFTGTRYDGYNPGDGFTFVVQRASPGYLGGVGGGLGYTGMPSSAGVAFNMMSNSIALVQNGSIGPYSSTSPVSLHGPVPGADNDAYYIDITYNGSVLAVTIDQSAGVFEHTILSTVHTEYAIDIPQVIGGDLAYVGFTAGSGRAYGSQYLCNLSFVPEPMTLSLLAAGALAILRPRRRTLAAYRDNSSRIAPPLKTTSTLAILILVTTIVTTCTLNASAGYARFDQNTDTTRLRRATRTILASGYDQQRDSRRTRHANEWLPLISS